MGRIVVSTATSLDGCAAGPDGDMSVMPLDQAFNAHNAGLVAAASRLLYGARTYRDMVGYWPGQLANPDPDERAIAERMAAGLPVTVVSDHLTAAETGPWRGQTTVVPRADAHAAVAGLRRAEGDTVVFGSRTVWADLLAHGLVDELQLLVGPRVLGAGTPVLSGVPRTELRLLDVHRPDGTETVVLRYAVIR